MSAVLTFEPLPDSECQFEPTTIELHKQDQVYIVGFPRHSLASIPTVLSPTPPSSPYTSDSECTRDTSISSSLRRRGEGVGARMSAVAKLIKSKGRRGISVGDLGISNELVEDKLCIVPAEPDVARKMRVVYAAIWLAPGYKVMFLPSDGSKVFYQRAIPGNTRWKRINQGYGVDLADPLMTVLDNAVHIKIDARPDRHTHSTSGRDLLRRIIRFIRRSSSAPPSTHLGRSRKRTFPYNTHPLIRQIHTEIEGSEVHDSGVHPYQIASCVRVNWVNDSGDNVRDEPERGELGELKRERESKWEKEKEAEKERERIRMSERRKDERGRERETHDENYGIYDRYGELEDDLAGMEEEVNPFLDEYDEADRHYEKEMEKENAKEREMGKTDNMKKEKETGTRGEEEEEEDSTSTGSARIFSSLFSPRSLRGRKIECDLSPIPESDSEPESDSDVSNTESDDSNEEVDAQYGSGTHSSSRRSPPLSPSSSPTQEEESDSDSDSHRPLQPKRSKSNTTKLSGHHAHSHPHPHSNNPKPSKNSTTITSKDEDAKPSKDSSAQTTQTTQTTQTIHKGAERPGSTEKERGREIGREKEKPHLRRRSRSLSPGRGSLSFSYSPSTTTPDPTSASASHSPPSSSSSSSSSSSNPSPTNSNGIPTPSPTTTSSPAPSRTKRRARSNRSSWPFH